MKAKLNRRGAIAAVSAVVMVPVIGFAGLAVDLSRIWLLNARLKSAVDAASLVAARTMASPTRDADTRALFWANFNQNGWSQTYLGSTIGQNPPQPVIEPINDTRIRVTAEATIGTTLFSIINPSDTMVRETTVAEREGTGLELSIVFDQTSSMLASAPGFATKLAAAQSAVGTLMASLYGTADTKRNLWVSVVPFSRNINIGTGNANFLDTTSMPAGWNLANWYGCVEARDGGNDITDISPATNAGQFRPYFWPNTHRRVGWAATGSAPSNSVVGLARNATLWATATGGAAYSGSNACAASDQEAYGAVNVNLYASSGAGSTTTYSIRFCRGDNDWGNALSTTYANNSLTWNPMYDYLRGQGFTGVGNNPTSAAGPNILCAMNPILPLTASRSTVMAAVNAIQAPPKSGGTTTVAGMQGAWYTLSPNWQNWWPNASSGGAMGALPLAYNTRNMIKAVVILTDGDNNWQAPYGCSSTSCSGSGSTYTVNASPTGSTELIYNSYGRTSDWNANFPGATISPVTQTNADNRLDGRFAAICAAMKGTASTNVLDHRIRIYVIGFEVAAAQRSLLQNCASSTTAPYYLEAPTAAALQGAFALVADSLSSLRLIE